MLSKTLAGAAGWALLAAILGHVCVAPYSKVEESFTLQATHDLLFHGSSLQSYDHKEFPGVVPRTFIGAAGLATVSTAFVYPMRAAGFSKIAVLYCVRGALGIFSWLTLMRLAAAVGRKFGLQSSFWFLATTLMQFHVPFYASRTLPNIFAFGPVVLAIAHWIDGTELWLTPMLLASTAIIFRCDMLLLTATVSLHLLATRRMTFWTLLLAGMSASACALLATVLFDSYFWGRWLWPEGEVFWFNAVLQRSSEWGVMPWHWYFSSALPRSLLAAMPLAVVGFLLERRLWSYFVAVIAFLGLYSGLGHKEVRFIFPVLPFFNVCASCALARIWNNRKKGVVQMLTALVAVSTLFLSGAAVLVFALAGHHNYPGGQALVWLHDFVAAQSPGALREPVSVHLDVYTCMTGVSRFLHASSAWTYDKTEDLKPIDYEARKFDYILTQMGNYSGYSTIHVVNGYHKLSVRHPATQEWPHGFLPFAIDLSPAVHIMQRN